MDRSWAKKYCFLIIVFVVAILCFSSCVFPFIFRGCWADPPYPPDPNPNKTQLYIGIDDSDDVDKGWIYDLIEKFENDPYWSNWQNPVYEDKKGVQVFPKFEGELYEQHHLEQSMPGSKESVYMINSLDFSKWLNDDNTSNMLVNLWDTVNKKTENGGLSIYDRMSEEDRDYYTVDLANGEKAIYALPHYDNYWGVVYDKDLIAEFNLYDLDEYKGLDGIECNEDDCLGPNGVADDPNDLTSDDGLPATWEDFKQLLYAMQSYGVVPFTWANKKVWSYEEVYNNNFLSCITASYEGKDDYLLRYNMSGNHSDLGTIDKTNAYTLASSEGIKAGLTVAHHISSDSDYYSNKAYFTSQSKLAAQEEFIMSTKTDTPIAFLLDSTLWENQASGTFEAMTTAYGELYAKSNRNFGWLPLPRFIGTDGIANQTNEKTIMYSGINANNGGWMLSANVEEEKKDLALGFIEFCNSEQMMARYTEITGILRPYKYDMSQEQINGMTTFSKTIYRYLQKSKGENPTVEIVKHKTRNPLQSSATNYFGQNYEYSALLFKGEENELLTNKPLVAFHDYPNLTVNEYLDGIKEIDTETEWLEKLGAYTGD